jgi:hypothetical protein
MREVFGRDIGILNEATKNGNKEIVELKREKVIEEIAKLEEELIAEVRTIEGKIAKEKLTNRLEDGIKEKKGLFNNKTAIVISVDNMTAEEAKTVLSAARDRDRIRIERDKAIEECENAFSLKNIAIAEKNSAINRLKGIEEREIAIRVRERKVEELYNDQISINENLNKVIEENIKLFQKLQTSIELNTSQNNQIEVLERDLKELREKYQKGQAFLKEVLKNAYKAMTNIVQAVGMLNYDTRLGYRVENLTVKQKRLIDGIRKYGQKHTDSVGLSEIGKEMNKHVGISDGIRKEIKALEPEKDLGFSR